MTTLTMNEANGENNITESLLNKYETLYNSVPTNDVLRILLMKALLTINYKAF